MINLLNDKCLIASKVERDEYGDLQHGTSEEVRCRFVDTQTQFINNKGEFEYSDATIQIKGKANLGDKVIHSGTEYIVVKAKQWKARARHFGTHLILKRYVKI